MASNGVYSADRSQGGLDTDYNSDPAAGGFFSSDYKKNDCLNIMLDSNKDGLKLEAMKRIIGLVARGKDASDMFPAVVKNVVSKNIEVKKLVYVYLVRYAEEQQDLALLSISTFQRALKDPNQLIRASALRVLSSIRVPVIIPIMMLAIKDAVNDMSPYVRKTAAHAIPKLYSLDPEQKDQLIEVIEKLLSDKTTLVVGSAVMAFEEVCPERTELIHKNYRKLVNLLVDVEEWGQVVIIAMLTRYARTQFIDPNKHLNVDEEEEEKSFYESDESSEKNIKTSKPYVMDSDHRLLLRNCKPLLQSRNAAVVMAVAQLYVYLAPRNEVNLIAKALIRLIHGHREIQSVVLSNIVTLSLKRKTMFQPYLKSFFVRSSDPTHIKLLKLEILTNLATETNVSLILREFQTYISCPDMEFVGATIQAIGLCACSIKEVSDTCLNGLVSLLSNRNEIVVAESVVVIKKLLQMQPSEHQDIIIHMARLMDTIAVPMARASILWLLGEYAEAVPRIAPDVLRKVAKTFPNEEDIVKLQTLNLAAKLYVTNSKQTTLLTQYVLNLAKYDQNYDIRDRTRFLKQLLFGESSISKYARKIILATKPAPQLSNSKYSEQDHYQLGSLSHYLKARANGYHEIPDFPEEAPDSSVRNVEVVPPPWTSEPSFAKSSKTNHHSKPSKKEKSFYSDSSSEDEDEISSASSLSDAEEAMEFNNSDKSSEESESGESEEESDSDSSEEDSEESSEESSDKDSIPVSKPKPVIKKASKPKASDLLLDLDDISLPAPSVPLTQMPAVSLLAPTLASNTMNGGGYKVAAPVFVSTVHQEALSRYAGHGLEVGYRFSRTPNIYSSVLVNLELKFTNHNPEPIVGLNVPNKKSGTVEVQGFPATGSLASGASFTSSLGIDYKESTQPASIDIVCEESPVRSIKVKAPVGELIRPVEITENEFATQQAKLRGLTENTCIVKITDSVDLEKQTFEIANVLGVESLDPTVFRFAGQTIISSSLCLVTLSKLSEGQVSITVNCDKMVIGSMLLKDIRDSLTK